ncbi:O-antigen ligase family protein, partial [Mycobacterium tuberculosis]
MVFAALLLTSVHKRILVAVWLALALAQLMVGALQIIGGVDSPLYFYAITNAGATVGFFANRNHLAVYFCCMLPFAALFASQWRGRLSDRRDLLPALAALFIPLIIVGIAVARSRAGIALAGVGLLGGLAVALRSGAMKGRLTTKLGILGATLAGLIAVALFGLTPIMERFQGPAAANELRFENWPGLLQLAKVFLPLGSGLGSFETVYRVIEPLEQVSRFYFNHAHNDYIEL